MKAWAVTVKDLQNFLVMFEKFSKLHLPKSDFERINCTTINSCNYMYQYYISRFSLCWNSNVNQRAK